MHKRAFGAVAVSGVAALALSACGGSSPTATNTAAATSAATTTTAAPAATTTAAPVRDASVDLVIWTDNDRAAAIKKYADQFGAEQGIKVAVQVAPDVRANFKDATNAGKGPDVIVGAHDWLGELVQNNAVSPIQMPADLQSQFSPESIAATKFNGQIYGVPYAVENIGVVRNTALAPDAPKTYEEMIAKGAELKKAGKADGTVIQEVGKTGNAYYTYPYLKAFGGGIFAQKPNGDYDPNKVIVNNAGSIKGAQQLAILGNKNILTTNVDGTNADALFDSGKYPYYITGPWAIDKAKKANIKYAISPLPTIAGGQMSPFLGVQMFYVSSKAKNKAFAEEFVLKYVPKKELQVDLFNIGHRPPALTAAYQQVQATDPDVKSWFEAGKGALPMPNIPAMNSVWGPLGQAGADVIAGKTAPQTRFDAAAKEIIANINKG
ncbi:ABC transporter substrate-binding protein [Intrasporangium oryzae NRRL B-24470]|uniref:ABC transporter substrate-binding protein n=1 Tax=Intrasporangium oryzae NRRL B-24470 TaxID=1386089 RepID=W9G3G8_9MICO|nr:maltose ABC transporter substrate-binding protein [Intrasporangium oryzae]EWS99851.1 ABC transporter substrate-binding protein [Intrasporangium oryzae NRRL B-24470]